MKKSHAPGFFSTYDTVFNFSALTVFSLLNLNVHWITDSHQKSETTKTNLKITCRFPYAASNVFLLAI